MATIKQQIRSAIKEVLPIECYEYHPDEVADGMIDRLGFSGPAGDLEIKLSAIGDLYEACEIAYNILKDDPANQFSARHIGAAITHAKEFPK